MYVYTCVYVYIYISAWTLAAEARPDLAADADAGPLSFA